MRLVPDTLPPPTQVWQSSSPRKKQVNGNVMPTCPSNNNNNNRSSTINVIECDIWILQRRHPSPWHSPFPNRTTAIYIVLKLYSISLENAQRDRYRWSDRRNWHDQRRSQISRLTLHIKCARSVVQSCSCLVATRALLVGVESGLTSQSEWVPLAIIEFADPMAHLILQTDNSNKK